MSGSPNPANDLADTAYRLRILLAKALAGGDDPSVVPEALEKADILASGYQGEHGAKVEAFVEVVKNTDAIPGVSRAVVLARGQRFFLSLAVELEERMASRPPEAQHKPFVEKRTAPSPPFDPALLALPGVGPKTAIRLSSWGICSPTDLLFLLPRRYDDRRTITPIVELQEGERVVTGGVVRSVKLFGRPWRQMMEVVLEDGGAEMSGMWFSSRRPAKERFGEGDRFLFAGLVSRYKGRLQIAHPQVVEEGSDSDLTGRIVPVYPEVPDVAGRTVEKAVRGAAAQAESLIRDPLPRELLRKRGLLPLFEALQLVHLPPRDIAPERLTEWLDGSSPAHRRVIYDEFFFIQLALALRRRRATAGAAPVLGADSRLPDELGALFGFAPTAAQQRVMGEIGGDLAEGHPMQRLLQGDVGSGKTFVALGAIVQAVRAGCQAALMAPTEILAEQHMRTLYPALKRLGARAALHLGSARSSVRKKNIEGFERGTIHVAIGTHALLQESVRFFHLGLAIVDEQHRFGVSQRLGLVGKGPEKSTPHLLVMTATPIPRTLALTIHGDLDLSLLDELPPGRVPIDTKVWPADERETALIEVQKTLGRGEQAYVVCPVIEESETLDVQAAEVVAEELAGRFAGFQVGLLHGRLQDEEKDRVMGGFLDGSIQLLVTTTVIEVGVDVPNATLMLVDGADRFGLAQLHQLRGRVGRSQLRSSCHLVATPKSRDAVSRLEVISRTTDGFELAEADLNIRGPGELYGRRQAGLPGFRYGDLQRDGGMLTHAREDVRRLLEADPTMAGPSMAPLKEELQRRILADDAPVGEEAG